LMTFVNEATKAPRAFTRSQAQRFALALSPFAPHNAEERWARLGGEESVGQTPWPEVDERYLQDEEYELVVQIRARCVAGPPSPRAPTTPLLKTLRAGPSQSSLRGKRW